MAISGTTDGGTKFADGSQFPSPRDNLQRGHYWKDSSGAWIFYGGPAGVSSESGNFGGYWKFEDLATLEKSRQYIYISEREGVLNLTESASEVKQDAEDLGKLLTIGPIKGSTPDTTDKTARYPADSLLDATNDYVFFQFGKYLPPFGKKSQRKTKNQNELRSYSQASYAASTQIKVEDIEVDGGTCSGVVLPMPQDLGNDLQQTWNGKQFSALGRSAIAGAAGGNFAEVAARIGDLDGNVKAAIGSLQTQILNKIPGVGGNISLGDITGSTEGIVLNPNAEILYDTPELREIGFTYKMIPRSKKEAEIIKRIVYMFRFASVPQWGGNENQVLSTKSKAWSEGTNKGQKYEAFGKQNFMRVPYLCKFTFMRGGDVNRKMQQFKPCAIRKVGVNYTSDGTYATYRDGEPVATELTLNFLESKILFKEDISAGF